MDSGNKCVLQLPVWLASSDCVACAALAPHRDLVVAGLHTDRIPTRHLLLLPILQPWAEHCAPLLRRLLHPGVGSRGLVGISLLTAMYPAG